MVSREKIIKKKNAFIKNFRHFKRSKGSKRSKRSKGSKKSKRSKGSKGSKKSTSIKRKYLKDILINPQGSIYLNFANKLVKYLKSPEFKEDLETDNIRDNLPRLPPIDKSDLTDYFQIAREFRNNNFNNIAYKVSSIPLNIKYTCSPKQCVIAKGTCFVETEHPKIINFYKCDNRSVITYRFGTPVDTSFPTSSTSPSKNITSDIISKIREFDPVKKIICISLLTPCNSLSCRTTSKFFRNVGYDVSKKRKGTIYSLNVALREHDIISQEKEKNKNFYHISFPLSSSSKFGVSIFDVKKLNIYSPKSEIAELIDLIDLTTTESTFKSIINIAFLYFFKFKNSFVLSYHCKSGKDRSSVYDCVTQATFYYLIEKRYKENKLLSEDDYESIRKYSEKYLLFGLLIGFYSTGVIGLKLKNLPVSKYIMGNNTNLLDFFIADSEKTRS